MNDRRLPLPLRRLHALFPAAVLAMVCAGAGCDEPDIVPPPPIEVPPDNIDLPPGALTPPAEVANSAFGKVLNAPATVPYDHRLRWHYARLMDPEVVTSFAGESDLLRELVMLPSDHPLRAATLDLLYANWRRTPRPTPHVRVALVRLTAALAPHDSRTTEILLAGLDDPTMKVRFRANNALKDIYAMAVDYDPNNVEAAPRAAAIARWKSAIQNVQTPPTGLLTPP